MILSLYILVFCFLILSGFFSGVETGIYVLDPLKYHVHLRQGDPEAGLLDRLLAKKSELVNSLLVGTNLSNFLATIFATEITKYYYTGGNITKEALLTTAFTTVAVLILGEMLPKNIYRRRANTLIYSSARAFYIFKIIFTPLVKILGFLTGFANLFFARHATLENEFLSRKSVEHHLTDESDTGALTPSQLEMVRNIMRLPVKNLTSSMIMLHDVAMVEENATRKEVREAAVKYRFSRMPVYGEYRSNVVGVINIFDIFFESPGNENGDKKIADLIRPIPSISRSARIDEALVVLRENRQPMGLVTGPGKKAVGIVTLKDLLEEITGEMKAW